MNTYNRHRFSLVWVLLVVTCAAILWRVNREPQKPRPIPSGDYTYTRQLAAHRLGQLMKQHHVPGTAIALIVDQKIIWQSAHGLANIEQEIPVTEDTVFKMLSLSKPFTALETMRLVEEGLVDLDVPLSDYVPDFTVQSRFPDGQPITIRHILAHRSGLPRNACLQPDWHFGADALEWLAASLKECFLAYPTGQRYKYSNVGYDILGYIIQEKRGQPFPVYMLENLLEPIGMEQSSFWSSELFGVGSLAAAQKAAGYAFFEGEYYTYEQFDHAGIPSGNLYATVGDMADFARFIFRDGEANRRQIIKPETLAAMFEDQYSRPADPQRVGLGWKIGSVAGSEKMIWHDGGPSEGIGSLVAFLPERKIGVVMVGNATSFGGVISVPLAIELLEAMLETGFEITAFEKKSHEIYPLEISTLAAYRGDYAVMGQIMTISLKEDHLQGHISGLSFDLVPIGKKRFQATHWLYKLGLAGMLSLPMDLKELEFEFQPDPRFDDDVLIINFGGITYEICPRYPTLTQAPVAPEMLVGPYTRYARLPSGNSGREKLGENEITIINGRLQMSGDIGPLLPINENTIIILSGPFAGETMTYDSETSQLTHQGYVFKPAMNYNDAQL